MLNETNKSDISRKTCGRKTVKKRWNIHSWQYANTVVNNCKINNSIGYMTF